MVEIRPAVEDDLVWMANPAAVATEDSPVRLAWQRAQTGEVVMLVATAGGRVAGRLWVDLARRRPYLWALSVEPALQGGGIGTALVAEGERLAAARGAGEVEIAVGLDNPRAEALYRRLGYRVVGTTCDEWLDVRPDGSRHEMRDECLLLRKQLD